MSTTVITQQNINSSTPLGANLAPGGVTFRVWGPAAKEVYLNGTFGGKDYWTSDKIKGLLLTKESGGYWSGFFPGAAAGDNYKFYVVGDDSSSYKRDPYARELGIDPPFPHCNCIIRDPDSYDWQSDDFRTPDYTNMIVYQAHVGTYFSKIPAAGGTFLDVVEKIEYLEALGINVLQLLPVDEFETQTSLGYNGSDLFSPETRYCVYDDTKLDDCLTTVNRLFGKAGKRKLPNSDPLKIRINQLKILIDLCHLYGMAVVFDVVYNHAGGFDGDDEAIYRWDRQLNDNLYFTDRGWAGGLGFALGKNEVRQFLIDNALSHLQEYHVDGLRYDEISALREVNPGATGWSFCQQLTSTVRFARDRKKRKNEKI